MKIKQLSGLVLLSALSVPSAAMACDACWGTVGLKEWLTTFSPGGGMVSTKGTVPMLTATIGYDKLFGSFSFNLPHRYSDPIDLSINHDNHFSFHVS